ncbi:hypothetical protein PILCRDRAFT_14785 [Piloderma croceum F 1598]|uniref:Uncharacterized protein n=1 Tax=Piloderma croceum (strain F 1598) TaxID=765440 RepID=A0A0C3AJD5_PILCF|nr:hypothetical protein PILCRDRAFT_14785 [Piloderma croceum F 1598]
MNTSSRALSKIITPKRATSTFEKSSLGDVQPLKDLVRRDPLYYNTLLIILVEAVLFKIPHSYFKNVDTFQKTYLFGPDSEEVSDGYTDQQPVRLDGIGAVDFRCLLKVMIQE